MTLAGLLLAGGLSRRMGRDKATMAVDGQPLWERQLSILRRLKLEALYISARKRPAWAPQDIEIMQDSEPSRGPMSGVALALNKITTSHLIVLAIDLPRLTAEYLKKLIGLASDGKGVVPYDEDQPEPLTAIYPKAAAEVALESLSSEDVSMRSFVSRLKVKNLLLEYHIAPQERILHRNLNAQEDLFC